MIVEIKRKVPTLDVYWTLTDFCNFKCNYCPDKLHSGNFATNKKRGFPTNEEISTFIDRLLNVHLKGRFLQVCLSGGEPTLHPMYPTIVERIRPHGIIETITNASRSIDWWKGLPALPDKVTISLHNGWTKIDKLNELGEYLLGAGVDVSINMMCDPVNWDRTMSMYTQLNDRLKSCVSAKILTDHSGTNKDGEIFSYSKEQMEFIKATLKSSFVPNTRFAGVNRSAEMLSDDGTSVRLDNPFSLVNAKQNSFKGWKCTAGSSGIAIHFDGYAYAGNCRIEKLGRIDQFELKETPITCSRDWCKTAFDIGLDKSI